MAVYARKYPEVIKLFTDPTSGVFYKAFLKVKFYCVAPEKAVLYRQRARLRQASGVGPRRSRSSRPANRLNGRNQPCRKLLGNQLTAALLQRLSGAEIESHEGKIIPIFTIDEAGWAHPALLSYYEIVAQEFVDPGYGALEKQFDGEQSPANRQGDADDRRQSGQLLSQGQRARIAI